MEMEMNKMDNALAHAYAADAATLTTAPINVRESVREYEALVGATLGTTSRSSTVQDAVGIETNALFHVCELRNIFEGVQGPLEIRASVEMENQDAHEAMATTTFMSTIATTATTTGSAIMATAAEETLAAPTPKKPLALHPLADGLYGLYDEDVTEEDNEVGAISAAYTAYVEHLVASKKADAAVTAARVGLLVEDLKTTIGQEVKFPLEPEVSGLMLDAAFMSRTIKMQALVFGDELQRASKWICDAEAREAALTTQLADREQEVEILRYLLAAALENKFSAAATATAETTYSRNEPEQAKVPSATTGILQDSNASPTTDTETDTDSETESGSKDDDDSTIVDYKRRCLVLEYLLEEERKSHVRALGEAMQRSMVVETLLMQARATIESFVKADEEDSKEIYEFYSSINDGSADRDHNGDDIAIDAHHLEIDEYAVQKGDHVVVDVEENATKVQDEDHGQDQLQDTDLVDGDSLMEGQFVGDAVDEDIEDIIPATITIAPSPQVTAPKPARFIVQPKIRVPRALAGSKMSGAVKRAEAERVTSLPLPLPLPRRLLAPGWALPRTASPGASAPQASPAASQATAVGLPSPSLRMRVSPPVQRTDSGSSAVSVTAVQRTRANGTKRVQHTRPWRV